MDANISPDYMKIIVQDFHASKPPQNLIAPNNHRL